MTMAARWNARTLQLGTIGYQSCLIFSLTLAMFVSGWRTMMVCVLSLMLACLFYRAGLGPLRCVWLWVLIAFLVVPSALLGDNPDWTVLGTLWSWLGLAMGIQMAARAVAIVVAVSGFAASVSISELAGLLECIGLKGLGFALGVAFNMLPIVQETATVTYHALRLRGGFRRERLQAIRLLLITIIVNSLRHADDIVSAAEARAFSPGHSPGQRIQWTRNDLVLTSALFAVAIGLLLL